MPTALMAFQLQTGCIYEQEDRLRLSNTVV
jgi:hypothetical protein